MAKCSSPSARSYSLKEDKTQHFDGLSFVSSSCCWMYVMYVSLLLGIAVHSKIDPELASFFTPIPCVYQHASYPSPSCFQGGQRLIDALFRLTGVKNRRQLSSNSHRPCLSHHRCRNRVVAHPPENHV